MYILYVQNLVIVQRQLYFTCTLNGMNKFGYFDRIFYINLCNSEIFDCPRLIVNQFIIDRILRCKPQVHIYVHTTSRIKLGFPTLKAHSSRLVNICIKSTGNAQELGHYSSASVQEKYVHITSNYFYTCHYIKY